VSASSSGSSSRPHAFPSTQVNLQQTSPPMSPTATPVRDSQDRTSRKRKASEIEIGRERGQSRCQYPNFVYPPSSRSSLYTGIIRL
jgi:hypothetical protein